MATDTPFEQRIRTLYAVSVPTELDRRIAAALTTVPIRHSRRIRPRVLAGLAAAAILAVAAAGPTFEWFGWYGPFDRLWEISTPVDQSVTADGYRVTVHRAYADRLGVRLAMTVEDLEDRWSGLEVDGAEATDSRGRVYEGWNWTNSRTPVDGKIAMWARFLLPDGVPGDDMQLQVTVTSLQVRIPGPIPSDLDPARMFKSVGGTWRFQVDVPVTQGWAISPPSASATGPGTLCSGPTTCSGSRDVTIDLVELGVVPSGTVVRLAVRGLPEMPAGSVGGWIPSTNIQHDGETLDEFEQPPGVQGTDGVVTIEALQVLDDLAGHWKITVGGFTSSGAPLGQARHFQGPWVLESDVGPEPTL